MLTGRKIDYLPTLALTLCLLLSGCGGEKKEANSDSGQGDQKASDSAKDAKKEPAGKAASDSDAQQGAPMPIDSNPRTASQLGPLNTAEGAGKPTENAAKTGPEASGQPVQPQAPGQKALPRAVGIIFDMTGQWSEKNKFNQSKILHRFDLLDEGSTVTSTDGAGNITVELANRSEMRRSAGDKAPLTVSTENAAGSSSKATTGSTSSNPFAEDLWKLAFANLSANPHQYDSGIGAPVNGLTDSLLKLDNDQTDFAPVLAKQANGPVKFTLSPVVNGKASESVLGPFSCDWHSGKPAFVSLPNYKPGLYEIVATGSDTQAAKKKAWLLISKADTFDQKNAAWKDILAANNNWSRGNANVQSAGKEFMRAVLYSFSTLPTGKDE